MYQRVKPKKVSEEIIEQIKTLVKDGKLQPGEQLPPERALAEMLGVGRPTLREALKHLEALGMVDIRKRRGIFVKNISTPMVSNSLRQMFREDRGMLPYLYEMRKDIEIAAAGLAAQRRTKADLAAILEPVDQMEKQHKSGSFSIQDDMRFHMAIARATHNFLRVHIMQHIFDISGEFLENVSNRLGRTPADLTHVMVQHRRVFEAISDQDPQRSRIEMEKHLDWVENQWLRVIGDDLPYS